MHFHAEQFDGTEYHCKSYAEFAQCAGVVVSGVLIPYVVECFASPIVGTSLKGIFGILKLMTPGGTTNKPKEDSGPIIQRIFYDKGNNVTSRKYFLH